MLSTSPRYPAPSLTLSPRASGDDARSRFCHWCSQVLPHQPQSTGTGHPSHALCTSPLTPGITATWGLGPVVFLAAPGQEGRQRFEMSPWQVLAAPAHPHGLRTACLSTHAWDGPLCGSVPTLQAPEAHPPTSVRGCERHPPQWGEDVPEPPTGGGHGQLQDETTDRPCSPSPPKATLDPL